MRLAHLCRRMVPMSRSSAILTLLLKAIILAALLLSLLVAPTIESSITQFGWSSFNSIQPAFVNPAFFKPTLFKTAVAQEHMAMNTERHLNARQRSEVGTSMDGVSASVDIETSTSTEQIEPMDADEAPGPSIESGIEVTWLYAVANTGSVDLVDVTVVDDQVMDIQCPQTTLAVGESMTCTASDSARSGQYVNTATVVANVIGSFSPVADSDSSHYFGVEPDLNIDQTTMVAWSYALTNTGQMALVNLAVDAGEDVDVNCPLERLPLGQSMTCAASGPLERLEHDAVVTAYPEGHNIRLTRNIQATPLAELSASVVVGEAIIDDGPQFVDVLAVGPSVAVGAEVIWRYTVENPGSFAIEGINGMTTDLVSQERAPISCPQDVLPPGESMLCLVRHAAVLGHNGQLGSFTGTAADSEQSVAADAIAFYQGVEPATVGGRLFIDKLPEVGAANGRQDPGEANLGPVAMGLTIALYRFDGTQVDERSPEPDGTYEFTGLQPDDYYITVHRPEAGAGDIQGFVWAPSNQSNNRIDNDVNAAWHDHPDGARTEFFRLESGEVDRSWDIGFQQIPLQGQLYEDINGNGQWDDGDIGIPGVTVWLSYRSLATAESFKAVTNSEGVFEYGPYDPGLYQILVEWPDEYNDPLIDISSDLDPTDGINFGLVRRTQNSIFLPILTIPDAEGGNTP